MLKRPLLSQSFFSPGAHPIKILKIYFLLVYNMFLRHVSIFHSRTQSRSLHKNHFYVIYRSFSSIGLTPAFSNFSTHTHSLGICEPNCCDWSVITSSIIAGYVLFCSLNNNRSLNLLLSYVNA